MLWQCSQLTSPIQPDEDNDDGLMALAVLPAGNRTQRSTVHNVAMLLRNRKVKFLDIVIYTVINNIQITLALQKKESPENHYNLIIGTYYL